MLRMLVRTFAVLLPCLVLVAAAPQSHVTFVAFGGPMTLEVSGTESLGTSSTLRLFNILPGGGPPAHIHTREDETYVVTQGHFRFWHGTRVLDAMPGSVVFLPRNEAHQWVNVGTTPGELILTVVPAGFERFFMEIGKRKLAMPKDSAEVIRLSTAYGITYVKPLAKQPSGK